MIRPFRPALLLGTALHGALAALLLPSRPALADPHPDVSPPPASQKMEPVPPTRVRAADHPGYSRVVFDFPTPPQFAVTREGNRVVARFTGPSASAIPGLPAKLRYLDGVEGGNGWGAFDVAHGAMIRIAKFDTRVVIDVLPAAPVLLAADVAPRTPVAPPRPAAPRRPAAPMPAAPAPAAPPHVLRLPATPQAAAAPAPDPVPQAAPVEPVQAAEQPAPEKPVPAPQPAAAPALAAAPASPEPASAAPASAQPAPREPAPAIAAIEPSSGVVTAHAVTLPFAATTGAAAFQRHGTAMAVFDEPRPIDVAGLQDDSVFAGATIQMLPRATVLRVKLERGFVLRLTRVPSGWNVAVVAGPEVTAPISPLPVEGNVLLPASQPSQVVTVPDPETGWNLLVGTQLRPGQGMAVARRSPAYVLPPTWQGVVVEPRSDRLGMRPVTDGFLLSAPSLDLNVPSVQPDAQVLANAAGLTRRFDFPSMPDPVLMRRMDQLMVSAAGLPPLSRFQARRDGVQAMIALGMGAEAESLLRLAVTDDPQHADDPDVHGLSAIAALLADRDDEADGLEDPALTGTDEVALWRAVRAARLQEGSPAAAAVFASTLPLLLSYPEELRRRLLPLAMETMALGGAADVANAMLAKPENAGVGVDLSFASGLLAQIHGDTDGALGIFDALAGSPDQQLAARARSRAVELRLAAGRIGPSAAADALSRQFMAWRAPGRELSLRLRAAALYAQAGAWRSSIELLHETTAAFPDDRPAIRRQMAQTFIGMLRDASAKEQAGKGNTAVGSLDLVSLADENPDLIPPGPDGDTLAALLADRLLALDLPRRAVSVLDKLMRSAPAGSARASLGARLAQLKLQDGDAPAALVALSDSDADGLPAPLIETRTLLTARATAQLGDTPKALAGLSGLATADADELRAQLQTAAKNWAGAQAALADLVALTVPASGPLTDAQQNLVLRLAGAAGQAGDEAALRDMAARLGPRMANKQLSDMFRLLTAAPVGGMADMPRVAGDIARARALPASLSAIRPN